MIRLWLVFMRRTLLSIAILGLVWIGYMAWPVYDLFVLIRAIETRDVNAVTRHVYFDAVRVSLTNQIVDAYVRRTGIQIGPLRRNIAAAAIANPVVEKLISPEALSRLLTLGWPVTVVSDAPPPGMVGITTNTMGPFGRFFEIRSMASAGSKLRGRPRCRRSNASILSSDFYNGTGNWSGSPFRKIFRTCLRMNLPRRRENNCHDVVVYGSFFRCQTAPWKYSYMLGGMVSLCSLALVVLIS
jgi:Protein of unknown function (DUF2939)